MCRNRFKKGIYCKNTRIDNANIDKLICQFANVYMKRNATVSNICKYICFKTGNEDLLSEIKQYQQFEYSNIEDIAIVISRFEVFTRNKIYADFIDGTEIMLIWGETYEVQDDKKIDETLEGEYYTTCKNCGRLALQAVGKKTKKVLLQ